MTDLTRGSRLPPTARRKGIALIVVLGLLMALGALGAEVARAVRLEAHTVASLRARTVGRYAAESGIALGEQRIRALLDSAPSGVERVAALNDLTSWLAPLGEVALGPARFGVTVLDLNARLDLNHSDAATLRNLFGRFTTARRAAEIAAEIREAPLARIGELGTLAGMDQALALAVAPYVTVSGDGGINVNSAPEPVLASLPALGEAGARSLIARRERGERFTSFADLRLGVQRGVAGAASAPGARGDAADASAREAEPLDAVMVPTRLMVISRGWQVGHPLTHEIRAVYAVVGNGLKLQSVEGRDR